MDTGPKNWDANRKEYLSESRPAGVSEEPQRNQFSQEARVSHSDFYTVNYLFATYLQTSEAGRHKVQRVEKIRPGKAKFYFDITEELAKELQLKFHNSVCAEFEALRKSSIDMAY